MAKKKKEVIDETYFYNKIEVTFPVKLTVLPLRDIIIFPNMIYPVLIGRASSLEAVAKSSDNDRLIFVSAQKNPHTEEPDFNDIYQYGVVAKVVQVLKLPNNLIKVLLEGLFQAKVKKKHRTKDYLEATIEDIEVVFDSENIEYKTLMRHLGDLFSEYITRDKYLPNDIVTAFESIEDPIHKLFFAAANVRSKLEEKQKLLEETDLKEQFLLLTQIIHNELEMLKIAEEIDKKVNNSIANNQKKYYIQEQIRTLQQELGEDDELASPEIKLLHEKIEKANLPQHALEKALEELDRLKKTPAISPEFSVNRTYLETMTSLPWHEKTEDIFSIDHVKQILDEDHYDLEKPKERILEYIAVLNFTGLLRRQILCFVGPPGVGKTSLAKSIARALGRKFIRFSLGGVRDEAEIRGHRKTYIGAMPGKIIQSMKKAGTINPVILLDEIDKMSMDFRGDPSAALLEVLDPEQNINFNDHYLEVDYDLSNVMFMTTANVRYDIPIPLQDRMEIIELNSYLENEKLQIAKRHIIPKLLSELGLDKLKIIVEDEAVNKLITEYTRESGVRNLEREIASVLRKLAKKILSDFNANLTSPPQEYDKITNNDDFMKKCGKKKYVINSKAIEEYLKAPKFKKRRDELIDKIGVANGLAWTQVGGDIMPIEVTFMPSTTEKLTLTGKLGDVMKESAVASLSFIRSNFKSLGIAENFNKKKEIHLHVPEGAIPKDGPSAGIAITFAIISAAKNIALRGDTAMTGEVTLRGNILAIDGLKEKILAAKRYGCSQVIIPKENERDIIDFSTDITEGLNIIPVNSINEALDYVFVK